MEFDRLPAGRLELRRGRRRVGEQVVPVLVDRARRLRPPNAGPLAALSSSVMGTYRGG